MVLTLVCAVIIKFPHLHLISQSVLPDSVFQKVGHEDIHYPDLRDQRFFLERYLYKTHLQTPGMMGEKKSGQLQTFSEVNYYKLSVPQLIDFLSPDTRTVQ